MYPFFKKFKTLDDLENTLNGDLKTLDGWAKIWKMNFNPAKI